jgi:hypothetical protein
MRFKYSGRIPEDDESHQVIELCDAEHGPSPSCVNIPGVGCVPQYAPTVIGKHVGYDPAGDCKGYFTSCKFQVHNNCYNYAVNIATNSMAQAGRMHGLKMLGRTDPEKVVQGAIADGLVLIGGPDTTIDDLRDQTEDLDDGHFVALFIASPDASATFNGDFHWVRSDDDELSSWSQKDGTDPATDFDFAGRPIENPQKANWTVNAGPYKATKPCQPDFIVTYWFRAWMFVPYGRVSII